MALEEGRMATAEVRQVVAGLGGSSYSGSSARHEPPDEEANARARALVTGVFGG